MNVPFFVHPMDKCGKLQSNKLLALTLTRDVYSNFHTITFLLRLRFQDAQVFIYIPSYATKIEGKYF